MIRQLDGERGQAEMVMNIYVANICRRDLAMWTEVGGRVVRPVYANTTGLSRLQGEGISARQVYVNVTRIYGGPGSVPSWERPALNYRRDAPTATRKATRFGLM